MAGRVEAGVGLHTRGPKLRSGRSVPGTRRDPVTGDNGRSAQHAGSLLVNAAQRQSVAGGGRLRPHLRLRLLLSWRSQHIVPTESTTYRFSPAAASYTVDRGANPLWSLSEIGFVPYPAWGSVLLRPPAPSTPSSIARKLRPITTTQASASPFGAATIRETHLAKKALTMRLPISYHHRKPLKKRSLKHHQ